MTRRAAVLAAMGFLLSMGAVLAAGLWRGPGALPDGPRDRPADLSHLRDTGMPLRVTVFGTSLSTGPYTWPEGVALALAQCLDRSVEIHRVTQPGASLDWAEDQVSRVGATAPDIIVMEFAINNADLRDGIPLAGAEARTIDLIEELQEAGGPEAPALILMTMNPVRGLRGVLRPRLAAHYEATRAAAARTGAGLVDLEARWRALPRSARGLEADGLHPDPDQAQRLIVPALTGLIGVGLAVPDCAVSPPT